MRNCKQLDWKSQADSKIFYREELMLFLRIPDSYIYNDWHFDWTGGAVPGSIALGETSHGL